jgi:hypothetical protein
MTYYIVAGVQNLAGESKCKAVINDEFLHKVLISYPILEQKKG